MKTNSEPDTGQPCKIPLKWKTTIQMLAIGFLLVGPAGPEFGPLSTTDIGVYGLWGAAALTIFTGYDYLIVGMRQLISKDTN